MKFERGKTNLRDIHKFMTSVDNLKSGTQEDVRQKTKHIIKNRIVKTFNIQSSQIKTDKRLSYIESSLNELKFEIKAYRNSIRSSKSYMLEFNKNFK
jgi:hypothetical protein